MKKDKDGTFIEGANAIVGQNYILLSDEFKEIMSQIAEDRNLDYQQKRHKTFPMSIADLIGKVLGITNDNKIVFRILSTTNNTKARNLLIDAAEFKMHSQSLLVDSTDTFASKYNLGNQVRSNAGTFMFPEGMGRFVISLTNSYAGTHYQVIDLNAMDQEINEKKINVPSKPILED